LVLFLNVISHTKLITMIQCWRSTSLR